MINGTDTVHASVKSGREVRSFVVMELLCLLIRQFKLTFLFVCSPSSDQLMYVSMYKSASLIGLKQKECFAYPSLVIP